MPGPAQLLDADVVGEVVAEWSVETSRKLRKRRKELGWTLDFVANLTGLGRQTIHRSEYNASSISEESRYLIANAYTRDVADFWTPMSSEHMRRRAQAVA